MEKIKIDKEELNDLYINQEYSIREIGKMLNCSHTAVNNNLKIFGIRTRSIKKSRNTERYITRISGKNHPNWKGGQITDVNGYILIWQPNHPRSNSNGYVHRSHLIAEKMLGRYLYPEEITHHENEIRNDDRPENIKITTRGKHASFHNRNRRKYSGLRSLL